MLYRDWEVLLRHVNRRANALADWFARDMRDTGHGNNLFLESCPVVLELYFMIYSKAWLYLIQVLGKVISVGSIVSDMEGLATCFSVLL
ncbi:hypothetical protein GQ457_03G037040 [Hibiscus cannabinus]